MAATYYTYGTESPTASTQFTSSDLGTHAIYLDMAKTLRRFFTPIVSLVSTLADRYKPKKNWRWFHCFSPFEDVIECLTENPIFDVVHRTQERLSMLQKRKQKRRLFVQSLAT